MAARGLAYKPEHALDFDTGAIIAAELHTADQGDTASLPGTLEAAAEQLAALDAPPTQEAPAELIADKGYHSRETLKSLADGPWKTRSRSDGSTGFCAGMVTMPRGGRSRSITIGHACGPAWRATPSGCAPDGLERSFALILTVAACDAPGCVGARTFTSAT